MCNSAPSIRRYIGVFGAVVGAAWQDAAMAPRRVHQLFAHRLLPEISLDRRNDLFAEAGAVDLGPRFVELWEELNRWVGREEAVNPDGLAAYVVMLPELNGVLVNLPEATQANEARYAMLVTHENPAKRLFFTSERVDEGGAESTQLSAWVPSASGLQQVNLGPRDDDSIDAFVNDVVEAVRV